MKDEQGINDARKVTIETLKSYACYLLENGYEPSYAQNLLSTCNAVLKAMRGDNKVWISPVKALGSDMKRVNVRTDAPEMNIEKVNAACRDLKLKGYDREASIVELCRHFGLRCREATLLDCRYAVNEYWKKGEINVTRGTKGGRGWSIDRWVPVTREGFAALRRAALLQVERKNLIPEGSTCHQFQEHVRHVVSDPLKDHGIKSLHELRAAYACDRYEDIAGVPTPCIAGQDMAEKPLMTREYSDSPPDTTSDTSEDLDLKAREVISQKLGHGRVNVLASYVGKRKRRRKKRKRRK